MSEAWLWMGAADLGRGIAAGDVDPVALTDTYLAAIEAHPYRDRIYARLTPDRARAEAAAAAARARAGTRRSVLDGVPISWKDLFDTAGVATEAGSALLKGRVPGRDAAVLANAAAAGLVCLGKTHTVEFAYSGLGVNPVTGTPPNVHDPDAVAGGSSSGAATSVAWGLAAAGIGSDTGGSVRIPSVWNDLVGLKTGHGRLSLEGVVPLCPSFDTVGPLCRSVEDAALLMAVMEARPAPDLRGATLLGVRLLALEGTAMADLDPEVAAAHAGALDRLRAAGATIDHRALDSVEAVLPLSPLLYGPEAYGQWKDVIEARPDAMYRQILDRFRLGASVPGHATAAAWQSLHGLRRAYRAQTKGYDAVILPTCPIRPPKIAAMLDEGEAYVRANLLTLRNTRIGNLLGLAVLTLPVGVASAGLSLQVPGGDEARLLRLGIAAETVLA